MRNFLGIFEVHPTSHPVATIIVHFSNMCPSKRLFFEGKKWWKPAEKSSEVALLRASTLQKTIACGAGLRRSLSLSLSLPLSLSPSRLLFPLSLFPFFHILNCPPFKQFIVCCGIAVIVIVNKNPNPGSSRQHTSSNKHLTEKATNEHANRQVQIAALRPSTIHVHPLYATCSFTAYYDRLTAHIQLTESSKKVAIGTLIKAGNTLRRIADDSSDLH